MQHEEEGPTYKVDISVERVQTRGLLDHGAQVSLIRKESLPRNKVGPWNSVIHEIWTWAVSQ